MQALFGGGTAAFVAFIIIVGGIGLYEFSAPYYGLKGRIISSGAWLAVIFGFIFYGEAAFIKYLAPLALLLAVFSFLPNNKLITAKVYNLLFSGLIIVPGVFSLMEIYTIKPGLIIAYFLAIQFNDGFSLLTGKKFGKRKIFPNLSPNKTLEGYLGGAAGLLSAFWILSTIVPVFEDNSLGLDAALLVFFFIFANAGDLLFSRVKRALEIKDFGGLLPGHGGILDRFDNILFAAPTFLIISGYYL